MLVVGFGVSGQAAARLLVLKGASVVVIDESKDQTMKRRARRKKNAGIETRLGVKTVPTGIGRFDAAVISPGIHPRKGLGLDVANMDIPIFGELEIASWYCQCPLIAITGTNGKTTTTELIEKVIRANRKRVISAGNIGTPLSDVAVRSDKLDYVALEVSSFQLETADSFRPSISVMMNITPDHLDRYTSLKDYALAKTTIWKNQGGSDIAVINTETERLLKEFGSFPPDRCVRYSIVKEEGDLWFDGVSVRGPIVEKVKLEARLDKTRLRGAHNAENVMATLAVAQALNMDLTKAWRAICNYKPLAHRLETVARIGEIEFVNDSKATNIDAMEKAIGAFSGPIILIAGGKDKGFDFTSVTPLIRKRVKTCVLIGEMSHSMLEAWKEATECVHAQSLDEAVRLAAKRGLPGDVVLLSPGCSSYDMFKNYEERGEVFVRSVQKLQN